MADSAPTPDTPVARRLVITVHGIQTFGHWQERLEDLLRAELPAGEDATLVHYKYGFFSLFAFLVPPLRWLVVRRFRRVLRDWCDREKWARIDLVGHSFGTHVLAWALLGARREQRPDVHTILLAGSVLRSDFAWRELENGCVRRVVNDCGIGDRVLLLSQFCVLFTGMAGRSGFSGATHGRFRNRFFTFGHSGYFRDSARRDQDDWMRRWWLPLLLHADAIGPHDERKPGGPLAAVTATLANNAEPVKLTVYAAPVCALALWIGTLYGRFDEQRKNAIASGLVARSGLEMDRDIAALPHAAALALEAEQLRPGPSSRTLLARALNLLARPSRGWAVENADAAAVEQIGLREDRLVIVRATGAVEQRELEEGRVFYASAPEQESEGVHALLSGDGQWLTRFGADGTASRFGAGDLRHSVATWSVPGGRPVAAAASQDGRWLVTVDARRRARVVGPRGTIPPELLDLPRLTQGNLSIGGLAIDGEGRRLAVFSDITDGKGFAVWLVETATAATRRLPHDDFVEAVGFSPDGRLATASGGDVILRDLVGTATPLRFRAGRTAASIRVSFSRDGRVLATSSLQPPVQVWSASDGTELARVSPEGFVRAVAFDEAGGVLATATEAPTSDRLDVRTWDLTGAASYERSLNRQEAGTETLTLAPDGRSIAVADVKARRIRVFAGNGRLRTEIPDAEVSTLSASHSPALLIGLAKGRLRRWAWPSLQEMAPHLVPEELESVSADGRLGATREPRESADPAQATTVISVLTLAQGTVARRFEVPGLAQGLTFSPKGRWLAGASLFGHADNALADLAFVADLRDPDGPPRTAVYGRAPTSFAFDANEARIAVGGHDDTLVLTLPAMEVVERLGEPMPVDGVALSRDGRLLASAGADGIVRVRNLPERADILQLPVPLRATGQATLFFGPDSDLLFGGFIASSTFWKWRIEPEAMRTEICARLDRPIGAQEWAALLPGTPYAPACPVVRRP
jgi:WD40 repeat protein